MGRAKALSIHYDLLAMEGLLMKGDAKLFGTTPTGRDGEDESSFYFFCNSLLSSRMETGLTSNTGFYDEDVNMYLVYLLRSLFQAEELVRRSRFVELRDTDLYIRINRTPSIRERFDCYRLTADHLLLLVSLFESLPAWLSPDQALGRSRSYYSFAGIFAS